MREGGMYEFGRRHRRIGIFLGSIALLLLNAAVPRGDVSCAIAPAVVAGVAAGGAILSALSNRRKASGYRPSSGFIKQYEHLQRRDVDKLYQPDAFSGPGLGFTKEQMAARAGVEGTEAQSEYKGNIAGIERQASSGSLRRSSGSYFRNKQRATEGLLSRTSDIRRRNILANAVQSRRDLYARLGAVGDAYSQGANILAGRRPGQSSLSVLGNAAGQGMMGFAGSYGVGG